MKTRPYVLAIGMALLSSTALAAPVFMLQFGSFETKAEAETRLNEVKSKHSGLVGNLPTMIREVALPPDNLKVYRTQAGPLPNRATAQSVCAQLASNGDQCYVVETALLPTQAPVLASAAAPKLQAPALSEPSVEVIAPSLSAPLASLAPTVEPGSVADEMAKSLTTTAPTVASTASMEHALEQAAATQAAMPEQPVSARAAEAAEPKKSRSFWSRLNPFSSSEESQPQAPAKPPEPLPQAAPVDVVASAPTPPAVEPVIAAKPPLATAATPFVVDPTMPPPPRPVVEEQQIASAPPPAPVPALPVLEPNVAASTSEPVGSPMFPPPPPPLRAQDRAALMAGQTPASAPPTNLPQSTGSLPAPAAAVSPAPTFTAPASVALPNQTLSPAPVMAAPVTLAAPSTLGTSAAGQKTLWAEIGRFADTATAMAFWDQYRSTHPDFPVVRTRVVSSYQVAREAGSTVALRIGPFARHESIKNLCSTIPAEQLKCGSVIDLGVSADPASSRR